MRRAALLATVAALVIVALGIVATAAGTPTSRSTRHPIPTAGISLTTPSSWRAVDSRAVLGSKAVKALLAENPQLAALIQKVVGAGSPVKFLALDPHVSEGFATNVNVVVTPVPSNLTLPILAAAITGELAKLPGLASKVTTSTVTLPIGRVVKASYRLTIVNGGKKQDVQTLQYIFLRHALNIIVTLSTTPSQSARRAATFKAIAASIHAP